MANLWHKKNQVAKMKSALKAMGKSPKTKAKSLKQIEEDFESNTGFDPEDPPPSLEASSLETTIPIDTPRFYPKQFYNWFFIDLQYTC